MAPLGQSTAATRRAQVNGWRSIPKARGSSAAPFISQGFAVSRMASWCRLMGVSHGPGCCWPCALETGGSTPRRRHPGTWLADAEPAARLAQHHFGRLRRLPASQHLGPLQVLLSHLHPAQSIASAPGSKRRAATLRLCGATTFCSIASAFWRLVDIPLHVCELTKAL